MEQTGSRARSSRVPQYDYYDYTLLFLTIILVVFGLVMIYSTSSYNAQVVKGDSTYYLKRQALSAVLGVIGMLVVSKVDYSFLRKKTIIFKHSLATWFYVACLLLQLYTLFFGVEINHARRWIDAGPLGTFQPSDLSKVAVAVFTAYLINKAPKEMSKFSGLVRIGVYILPMIVLVGKENMSTAIVIAFIAIAVCFVASPKKRYFVIVALVVGLLGFAYILLGEGFRAQRIEIWRNVETHPKGFQILQGLYAIASGGLTGTGLGGSFQKLGYLPEAFNDMIFCIICEELGILGAITVIVIFALFLWRIFIIAINSPDLFGGLVCTGILAHFAVQVLINIAVVTNSIPSTGIPLPFISYGGTSVAVMVAEVGIVLSVSSQIRTKR
ncbi:MAG: FtsW/RodA/SpoVE family cell cycle protein [Lachnospiraceae bacterium]|nr:FtsW/RodA/SpoVE family cell cycle protein [Lachnospiraceae bacterium]